LDLLVCGLVFSWACSAEAEAQTPSSGVARREATLAELQAAASIAIDHFGIAHIYAASPRDAFLVQGYNAARDRLWQIDLWRKRGLGLLAKSFGPSYVAQDRAARLLLYRGDIQAEWAAYPAIAREAATAFVAGINAYVREVRAGKQPLPPEFALTSSQPELWLPEDVVRVRSHALVGNVKSEVTRARVACLAGLEADRLRRTIEPAHKVEVPAGLDPCDVPADVLKAYLLATDPVSFHVLAPGSAALKPEEPALRLARASARAVDEGSNNWVVSATRSATGRPILANDPHRQLGVPSLRYLVHLEAPGLSLAGAGEPALPGVALGHNAEVAFGITIFAIDQEDLYVYELAPDSPRKYRYGNGYEPMRVVVERIEVKGQSPQTVRLLFTRHGPVLRVDEQKHRAFALRTAWNEPGAAGYLGSSYLWQAKSWEDFVRASNAWGAPPLNLVYADVHGDVGWSASGRTPVRPNWDGLLPVPGDGRYEWQGFLGRDVLPRLKNPEKGFLATANEMNLPEAFVAQGQRVGFEWTDRSRIERITAVLGADPSIDLADSMAVQCDAHSVQAARLLALLRPLSPRDKKLVRARALLVGWDGDERIESAAAALYETWALKHLRPMTVERATPAPVHELLADATLEAIIRYLEQPGKELGADPRAARDALLLESLARAVAELEQRLGPDPAHWHWGSLHRASFEPAVAELADPALRAQLAVGPLQTPGSASTPHAATYRTSDFTLTAGASVRMVLDVGNWDASRVINTPGQAGDPFGAHYRDLFPRWAACDYVPFAWTRAAVDQGAETIWTLKPKR
jgi:penicillin amidase